MKEISLSELNLNPYEKIGKEWMLLTAGSQGSYNTMTCSWGHLGSHSGRDGDKVAAAGLTPVYEEGYTYFAEASLVLVCRKLYRQTLTEEAFLDKAVMDKNYPSRDFHDLYIGHIEKVLVR